MFCWTLPSLLTLFCYAVNANMHLNARVKEQSIWYIGAKKLEAGWQERITAPELWSVPWNEEDKGEEIKQVCIKYGIFILLPLDYWKCSVQNFNLLQAPQCVTPFLTSYSFRNSFNSINTNLHLGIKPSSVSTVISADGSQCHSKWVTQVYLSIRNTLCCNWAYTFTDVYIIRWFRKQFCLCFAFYFWTEQIKAN